MEPQTQNETYLPLHKKSRFGKKTLLVACSALILMLIVGGYAFHRSYNSDVAKQQRLEATNKALEVEVAKLMILPEGETPVIYQIDDPAALIVQQPFFAGSQKGDRLIVYPQSAKAIIYSPARKLIVNVGPVSFDSAANRE